jgi:uncharacterized protein with HEPN domain
MKRNNLIYLNDILSNMKFAKQFISDISFEQFASDNKTQYAVIRCIEVIGEAAKQVTSEIKEKYKNVPWREIAGMRDKLIHSYFGINIERVWLVVKEEFDNLEKEISNILKELNSQESIW